MSAAIIGYVNLIQKTELAALQNAVRQITSFGFEFSAEFELYNYPEYLLRRKDIIQFQISDSADSNTAGILLEPEDYDPDDNLESEFQKKFPSLLKDRILEITKIIRYIVSSGLVKELGFSISFCDEIGYIKECTQDTFEMIVLSDCLANCPPNTLYIIKLD